MPQETEAFIYHARLFFVLIHILPLGSFHAQGAHLVGDATNPAKVLFDDFAAETIHYYLLRDRLQICL